MDGWMDVRIIHFKTQTGPTAKNATIEPSLENRGRDPATSMQCLAS